MISYETHVLPNSDYYVYTPSTLAKNCFSIQSVPDHSVTKVATDWRGILTTAFC